MNNFLRAIIAGWGARKLGGGCLGTIIAFFVIFYALGTCNSHPVPAGGQKNSLLRPPAHKSANVYVLRKISPPGA